jgi:hypothetical protein
MYLGERAEMPHLSAGFHRSRRPARADGPLVETLLSSPMDPQIARQGAKFGVIITAQPLQYCSV